MPGIVDVVPQVVARFSRASPMRLLTWLFVALAVFRGGGAFAEDSLPSPFDAERTRLVDLSLPLNDKTPVWPGDRVAGFRLETIATLEKDGMLARTFSMPEHMGTHIDAPNHFAMGQPGVEGIPAARLFGPGVRIDMSLKAEQDADAMLTVGDIEQWERRHGPIPKGAIVLLQTGWGRHVENVARYQNRDATSKLHFPGYSPEAAAWLVRERDIRGLGIDTMSVDRGLSQKFEVHHVILKAGRYALENVTRLEELPPKGFGVVVAPIKIDGGTGGPTRIWGTVAKPPAGDE
jgi:kynurenine formamidase